MGAQWAESFQVYPSLTNMLQGVWSQIDSSGGGTIGWRISTDKPESGAQGMKCLQGAIWPAMRRIYNPPVDTGGLAFRFWVPILPIVEDPVSAMVIAGFFDVAAQGLVLFVLGTNGAIVAYGGGIFQFGGGNLYGTTLLKRSLPCVLPVAWNHIEFRVTPGVVGAVECRVNGVTVLNFIGNTIGHNQVGQIAVAGACAGIPYSYLGAMHAWDTLDTPGPQDFVGNASVRTRLPNADASPADWTLSSGGVGWSLLVDNNDATYIQADTVGLESAFGAGSYEADVTGIVYQQVNFRAIKTEVGDCDVEAGITSGGFLSYGPSRILSNGEAWFWDIIAEDPASSGAPFSVAAANASGLIFNRTL